MEIRTLPYVQSQIKNTSGSDKDLEWNFGEMDIGEKAYFEYTVGNKDVTFWHFNSHCSCTKDLKFEDGKITGYLDLGFVGQGPEIHRTFKVRFFADEPEWVITGNIGRKNPKGVNVTFDIKGKLK